MKDELHPDYVECEVTCGCGETFTTRATVPEMRVEVCSKCHPFYTGKQKLVDSTGRVERFQKRWGKHIEERLAAIGGEAAAEASAEESAGETNESPAAESNEEPAQATAETSAETSVETSVETSEE